MNDIRPDDHVNPQGLPHDLPDHVGNIDEFGIQS